MSKYAELIETAKIKLDNGDEARAERLIIQETGETEIRFSWWTQDGKQFQHAPLDVSENDWLRLLEEAINHNVFSKEFINGLSKIVSKYNDNR